MDIQINNIDSKVYGTTTEFSYFARVAGLIVEVSCTVFDGGTVEINFKVDGDYERLDLSRSSKLAITRWLLGVWEVLKSQYSCFCCMPYEADGMWRHTTFAKLGFELDEWGYEMTYVV